MMLKKMMVSVAVGLMTVAVASAQLNQPWEDMGFAAGNQTRLFDFEGNDVTLQASGFLFQMVVDPQRDTSFDDLLTAGKAGTGWAIGSEDWMFSGSPADYGASDDVVVGETAWLVAGDVAGIAPTASYIANPPAEGGVSYWNAAFYFRWFNADTPENATQAGIIYNPDWRTPAPADPPPALDSAVLTYGQPGGPAYPALNQGSDYNGEGWQSMPLVPEPGTFALFGIGLLTVAARRKLRKQS